MPRTMNLISVGVLFAACAFSQAFTGSISGLVTDPTGALLTDAKIIITDIKKNTNHKTSTNDAGFFLIGQLEPGTYRVTAEKPGFRKYVLDAVPLSTQQKVSANIAMELGSVTENVQVTAEAQLVESTTSTLGAVVENKRIVDLPLNGRNIYNLAALVPGVFMVRQMTGIADTFKNWLK